MEALLEAMKAAVLVAAALLGGLVARLGLVLAIPVLVAVAAIVAYGAIHLAQAARRRALGVAAAGGGLTWRSDLFYAPGHTWLGRERGSALRVGVDDLAQHILYSPLEVKLPEPGATLREGQTAVTIRCGEREVAIPAPVGGRVIRVNPQLEKNPAVLRRDPYVRGWLYAVEPEDARYAELPTGDVARAWLAGEGMRLTRYLEGELGVASADGGELLLPAPKLLKDEQWTALVRAFLGPA